MISFKMINKNDLLIYIKMLFFILFAIGVTIGTLLLLELFAWCNRH